MLSQVTIDDQQGNPVVLHETATRCLVSASGLIGVGGLREQRRVRPQAHGAIDDTRFEDGRLIALEGEIMSAAGVEAAYSEFRQIVAPLLATLDGHPARLCWTEGTTGLALQRMVRLAGEIDPPLAEAAAVLRYQVQLYAEDPRAYTQQLTVSNGNPLSNAGGGMLLPALVPVTFGQSSGGDVTWTNQGNRATPPVLRIYGRAVNPQVLQLNTGQRIALTGTIEDGSYLDLDTAGRVPRDPAGGVRLNLLDAAASTWFGLPAASVSALRLVAADFSASARLDVLARSAYA